MYEFDNWFKFGHEVELLNSCCFFFKWGFGRKWNNISSLPLIEFLGFFLENLIKIPNLDKHKKKPLHHFGQDIFDMFVMTNVVFYS
jgi:hypothetical protein